MYCDDAVSEPLQRAARYDDCSPADKDDELHACPADKEIKACVRVWDVNGISFIQGDPFETLAKCRIPCFTYLLENKT